jgi:hypothetical protein
MNIEKQKKTLLLYGGGLLAVAGGIYLVLRKKWGL